MEMGRELIMAGTEDEPVLVRMESRKTAVFYGDSNTYGIDPSKGHSGIRYPKDVRWVDVLQNRLFCEWRILESSKVGRCIPSMDFELEELDGFLQSTCSVRPIRLFAIMLGVNDYLSQPRPNPDRVGEKMERMLDRVQTFYAKNDCDTARNIKFLVIAPPPVDFTGDRFYEKFSTKDGMLASALQRAAKRSGADYLDTSFWNLPLYPGDHLHLTEDGHRIFAEHMLQYMRSMHGGFL